MSLSNKLFFGFCLGFCLTAAQAQYRFDSWTADNGLPQNSVYAIAQTPDGYLWLTTLDGLVRFDGVKFTVFNKSNSKNLTTNRFINLFAEADGTLWLGTEESGLVRYRNGQFQTFTTADGLPSNQIRQVQKDLDGNILVFTSYGLARFRDERFSVERQGDSRNYKIYVSPFGTRWEMDKDGLRAIGKDGRERRFDLPFEAGKISPDRTFNYFSFIQMLEDRTGALWLAAAGSLFRLKDGVITSFTAQDGMPSNLVRIIAQDRAGAIWIGTEKQGACRLGENRFDCFDTAKEHLAEISTQSANAIAEVREIAYNLRPYLLDRLGLTKAISSMLNKIADTSSLKLIVEIDDVDSLFENEAEISIYRIIQESLNNILKHAEASEVKVSIAKTERNISIKISDNGKGFDVNAADDSGDNRSGFGLLGMSERVRILGGTISKF